MVAQPDSTSFGEGAHFGYLHIGVCPQKDAKAGRGETVFVDGISGTLGLGVLLSVLASG